MINLPALLLKRCGMMNLFVRFAKGLNIIDKYLTRAEEAAVFALLFVMTCVIFLSVVERFLLQLGITWAEELARFLSVWGAFIGSALAAKKGAHIGIEAVVQMLPRKARKYEELAVFLFGLAFSAIILYIGVGFMGKLMKPPRQLSPAMRIPMVWAYAAVPFGCGLMATHYFIKFVTGVSDITFGTSFGGEKER
jgi:C4-dicarboxylate transporter DctQ subunit